MDWDRLASEVGAYSVIDSKHPPEEFDYVTQRQKEILFPLLKQLLSGNEQTVLDFGCGPGRFTGDLAELIGGKAVGYDVTLRMLELAPKRPNLEYVHSDNFLAENNSAFDVIWICLVFGGIPNLELATIARNLTRALRENGLLFLAESTGKRFIGGPWSIRTRAQLKSLFPSIPLVHIGTYYDANQEVSVLAGRRITPLTGNPKSGALRKKLAVDHGID